MLPPDRRGTMIGRYVVLDILAEGGMGIIYTAYDAQLDRKLAIKVLHRHLTRGEDAAEVQMRLLREAQAMARLAHPNVVALHDVGTFEGNVFLAMEYVEGGSLKEWLTMPHSWRERLQVLRAAGRGLAAAHAAGMVHRDFKPDNVLVGRDGRVRVTDFGIAHLEARAEGNAEASAQATARTSMSLEAASVASDKIPGPPSSADAVLAALAERATTTSSSYATGGLLGTVGYMAPEQAFSEPVDARTDQFSFCATLYYALYGQKAFPDETVEAYVHALGGEPREPPAGTRVPGRIWRILARGLKNSPDERYPSMDVLLAALDEDPAAKRRKWLALAAVFLGGALAVLGYRRLQRQQDLECAEGAKSLSDVWDDAVREDVRKAFDATGDPVAADSFTRVAKVLDTYASGWAQMQTSACEATRVRREQSEEVYRLRSDCLDRQKTELRALTSMFRRADTTVVESSVKAAYGLTAPSWCADVNSLRASAGLPVDPVKRGAVLEARTQLAEAKSLYLSGKYRDAAPLAELGIASAQRVGHTGTEAEALYLGALIRERRGYYPDAEAMFGDSLRAAYASGNDAVVVRAASELGFIVGDKLYRPREAELFTAMANGGLVRLGGSEELEAEVISIHAILPVTEGHPERAVPMFERSIRSLRKSVGENPLVARRLNNLGYAYHVWARQEEALTVLRESRSMYEMLYGRENEETAVALSNIGASELALGHLPEADVALARALAVFERENREGFWAAWVLQYQVLAATIAADWPKAAALGRRNLEIARKLGTSLRLVPGSHVAMADVLLAQGNPAEALALCDEAIEVQEKVALIGADRVYEWDALRCRGEALVALGRPGEGVGALERTVALPRRVFRWDLPRAKLVLARALDATNGDRARARELAEQARDELAPLSPMKAQRLAADQWLSAHAGRQP